MAAITATQYAKNTVQWMLDHNRPEYHNRIERCRYLLDKTKSDVLKRKLNKLIDEVYQEAVDRFDDWASD